ncbi:SDR family NAD(P)-dependent oxidoreductase [Nocardia sp. NPDC057663]|uniref:SDR family NAD(P)-dependent oxidoreductase n=1 Tax=Nocardia sp. NPDC057663 TaxID=3346201 RepID=UPI00366E3C43
MLITGASSGLGEGMARNFAALGRDLALCARRSDRLHTLREELRVAHPGIRVSVRELDVNDHDQVFEVFHANRQTAQTNFVAALAQCEAAVEIFRRRHSGHLVVISSISAVRGLPRNLTTYAATKAGVAVLAEGIRAELLGADIAVTTLYPGYIDSEMTSGAARTPLMVSTDKGVRAMVKAIEAERVQAKVPAWPGLPLAFALRTLPLRLVAEVS